MSFYNRLRRYVKGVIGTDYRGSSTKYIEYLRRKGVRIGAHSIVFDPHNIEIDVTRPELLEIGSHVFLHRGTKILTHDWASWCFVYSHAEFLPSHGKVTIGNNVWLGENVTICKGVKIGDNVIIGIGSVVTKSIPSNSVAAGVPAKVLCSYDEYYQKRQKQYVNELVEYANAIIDSGREPVISDFYDDYPAFCSGINYRNYQYPYHRVFNEEQFNVWKMQHKALFSDFDSFMDYVNKNRHGEKETSN